MSTWWVGGYTSDAGADAEGIRLIHADENGWLTDRGLAVRAASPSFLATHPFQPVVYAVHEMRGTVEAYAADDAGFLTPIAEEWPAGPGACHLTVDPGGRFVIASCWGTGDVILFRLDAEGRIINRRPAESARDPHADTIGPDPDPYTGQARRSRAHASAVLRNGTIATTDLGYDLLRLWVIRPIQGLIPAHDIALPPGSGPRHLVEHPDGRLFIDTEYSLEVLTLTPTGSTAALYAITGSTALARPAVGTTAAGIALSHDGTRLYVGLRGSDCVATLDVGPDRVELVDRHAAGGRCPRHHVLAGSSLYVVNQESHDIAVHELDPATGSPVRVTQRLPLASPTCMVRAPQAFGEIRNHLARTSA